MLHQYHTRNRVFRNKKRMNGIEIRITAYLTQKCKLTFRRKGKVFSFKNDLITRSTTAADSWHLKVKEDISLTKNHCITISIQKTSSIHKLIFKMQQILASHEQTIHGHF